MTQDYRQLIIIDAEIKHSFVHKNITTWKDESILDRLINDSYSPAFVINLSKISISFQQLIRYSYNSFIKMIVARNYTIFILLKSELSNGLTLRGIAKNLSGKLT